MRAEIDYAKARLAQRMAYAKLAALLGKPSPPSDSTAGYGDIVPATPIELICATARKAGGPAALGTLGDLAGRARSAPAP
jgi:hypothetical protein